jgi:alkylated DNA repair dioxygenase AlkB
MATLSPLPVQPDLFGGDEPRCGPVPTGARRMELGAGAWVDHAPGWLRGHDALFAALVDAVPWTQPVVPMWERKLLQPRLSAHWAVGAAPDGVPPVVDEVAAVLADAYDEPFAHVGVNLYRDGRDSVAWHGDRIGRERAEVLVALVSLGAARPFLLRPKGGGRSTKLLPAGGDLLVMGGTCQRTWQHAVPKVASAGPRLSITFRAAWA